MRKFLLSTIALMMSVAMMAVGAGNGTSKANAIDFDWANGHKPALSAGSWYRVSLSPLKAQANDPTLALYLTNLTDETAAVSVTVEASLLGQSSSSKFNYNIAGKDYQLWSKKTFTAAGRELSLKQMMDLGLSEIYLQLTANKEIALSAKVYETEDIVDDACSKAKDFDWTGVSVPAGEQWYRLNLAEVKMANKQLKFVVANNGVSAANVAFDMSLDCPASAVIEKDWVIAAGAEQKDELGRVFLDVLNEDYVFVKLTTNQPLTLSVEEEVVVVDPDQFADFDCASAPELVFDEEMNLTAGKHVYKVRRAELIAERDFDTEFHVTNNTDAAANLAVEVAFACPVKSVVTQNLVIDAHESIMKLVKGDMLKAVNSEWVYIRFVADQDLTATVGMRNVSPCVNALPFDWNVGAALNAGESQWYDVDITSLKQNKQHVRLSFTNHSDAYALVNVEVALDCNGTILPMTLPIPAGLTVSQTIDYQLLARSPLNRIYVGVSTDSYIELAASTKDAIAADQTPCLNAIAPEHGVEYTHEANTTQWYKISLDLLKSTTDYSSIYLANKGNSRAHVTVGMVTDCQYTTGTTLTIPVPAGLEVGALAPNVLGRLIQELTRFERAYNKVDAKDVYLEIHSDQPLAFGLDVVNKATNPCLREDLITFDWNKGAKVVKGEPKWFDMDIDAVKAAGKHVKLTFTNHTDSIVWAATVVSAECPAKLTMPLLVPVPAGMSVDKVINYQLFAVADIHNIYIGVMTDGALELKAESTDATILPPADCLTAKTVVSGEEYVQQAGTQWYQFPMSLIDEMGKAASISFKNMTSKHATLTAGVTIGCDYAAATVAKVKVPRDIEFTLNVPKLLLSKVRGLVDPAITSFYLQLTTDQAIAFSLNTQAAGVNACASAVEFDWTAWETDGLKLKANEEQWYKVNIAYPLEKLKNGEDITLALSNPNLMPVEVDLAVSPTCPVVLSLEKSVTIPAGTAVSKTLSYDEVMKLIAQYDKYDLADRDFGKLMEQINVYVLYNKLVQVLEDRGYDKYLPLDKIDPVVNKYGESASLANLKELVENYDKYLTVAELKSRLEPYKEKVSIETLLGLIDKYGDYIPYVDAQQLIDNADVLIPYIGTATAIVDKCKQYISKDDLKQLVERIKSYVPFEEMKKLAARLEKYLPEKNTFYVYVKASGDLEINPGAPIEPDCSDEAIELTVEACESYEWHGVEYTTSGDYTYIENVANCEDAEWLDWKQPIKLSEFTAPWYKLDVSEIITNESDFSLTLVNDLGATVQMPLELHYYCSEDGDGFIASDSREIAEGTYTREIPYALFDEFIGPEYETIYLHNVNADCDRVEVLHLTIIKSETTTMPIEYATICEGETYDWRGNTYSVSDTIVVEEALECGKAIHTLKLDVINGDTVMPTEYKTICEGETYTWRGTDYTVADTIVVEEVRTCGTATYTLVLDVINGNTTSSTEATICEGENYEWRGNLYNAAGTYTEDVVLECGTATYTLVLTVKDCSVTPQDPCENAELVQWDDVIVVPANADKWYKVDYRTALASGKDIEVTLKNGADNNNVEVKFSTECFDPNEVVASAGITVKAKVPASWTDQIYVWVWPTGGEGHEEIATKDGDWWTYTHQGADVNILFKEGTGWKGLEYQTVDMSFTENACVEIEPSVWGDKATYIVVECDDNVAAAGITVKAKVPANWTDQIYVWVWPTGGEGHEEIATKDGDWWTYTHQGADVNILFKEGTGWKGLEYQTVDMSFTENACVEIEPSVWGDKATYTVVECDDNVAGGATYNTFATSFAPYETQQHTLTQADMARLGIVDYVYAHVTTTGEFTVTADTIDTPVVPECEDTYYEFTYYFCGVKVSWDGVIYDQPGDYTHKYLRADGCYDVVTMHLIEDCTTPCTPVYTEFDAVFCGEYNWNGTIYTAPGDYEQTLTAVTGCDSIVTMHLTEYCPVTPECENVYTEFSTTFCGSFTWNGVVYTEAGDYVQTLSKTDGCDSIVTLHLEEDCQTPPVLPENPCLNAIPFDWTVGAFLAAGEAQWYEMDITSLIENKQHLMLNFINHSDENAWINVVVALDCEGKMVPVMLPVLANMNVDQTIDYQILKRSPEKRIYVGVYTKEADIELKSAVRSAIATDQTPCLNATEVQYNETYVHEPGTSWYKVSVDLLKNNSDALGFYFANKGNKHAHVTVGMVADCYYTTGTTITLPIPSGVDFNVLAPNLLKVLMQEVESFEEKLNDWDVQEIYVELTSDQTIEFALKAKDGNYDCESAIDFDWADWEANGIQLQADQDVWYRMNMEYPIEKLLREEEVVIAITNLDSVAVDVEMTVSPTCPVVVSVDKSFSVPARTAVKKTLSYADAMQWLSRHDAYLPYDQIQLFVDKYGDHLSVAELKNMLNNYEKYISVEQLKQELAKHKDYVSYETVEAALAKYGKYIPYVDAEALLKKYEDELLIAAGYAVVVLKECDPYITAENFWQVVDYCKPYIPVEELKHLLEIVEKHLTDYTCYLRVKTTGDLYVGPKPLPIPCDDVLVEETVEACGQYEWKGVLYTVSGDYTFTQPLADPANAEFLDWKQPIKLSEFTAPWYKVDVTEVIATHSDFTLLIENDLNETQEVTLALHDAMAEFLLSGSWKVATGVHPKTVTFEEFEQIVDPEHKVLYLHNVNYDCERTEVLHLTIKNCDETITAAVCDGTVYVDPITNVEHLISSLVPSTLTWTETVLTANKEKTTYTYVITPIVAPAALTAEVLATIPGATPVLTPGLMPNVAGTAEAIKAYYESIDTESVSDVVSVYWETVAVACGATSHTMTLVVEDDCDNIVKAEITLEVAAVEPVEETVTACDSYEWNGETYTVSGDYEYTTTNANGCDSVVILHLTINKSEVVEETVTACDSYEWNGQTYTESGDYTFNTVAANGCDRTEILHLTINTTKYEEVTVVACDSYEWNGQTYTESGDYTFNTVAANGCDRTEILHLTINTTKYEEVTVVACDSYEWNGETYTESVDKTFTTVATNGCDSVVTLHLTITKSEVVEETVTACDSYTWNGETYTESGDYVFNTTTADGCERVETLHLTINKSATAEETVVTCDSYEWNGETYTESGDYVFNTTTTAGCDSVVTLHLTILPEAVTETEDLVICESEFPYLWRNQVLNAPGTYEVVEQYEATSCDSVIHVLNLQVYALTLPTSVSTPIAVCGHTVDVSKATTEIEAHIAANLYAQNVTIVWEVQNAGGAWLPVADVVLNGTDEAVTVRYTINSDCGSTEPVVFDNVPVEMPNPSNDVDMDNISAISKYGNRIILLNLNAIQAAHGWIPEPEDVMWYRVVNGLDVYGEPGDDEFTGKTGHYFNYDDATSMTGQYYALIVHNNLTNPNECEMYMRTEVITCSASGIAPRLMPNVARPNELLTLTNLNSADVTEIRVYSASGELLETYVADQVPEFIFNAAHTSGFYMVDVQTQDNKVTLRYIVK